MNRKYTITALIIISVVFAAVLFAKEFSGRSGKIYNENSVAAQKDAKSKGPEDAPIQLVEYSDFQCPACQKAERMLHEVWERYPGKIRFTFRHFPLQGHQWSGMAHQAAECAALQDKFWEYHDALYTEQNYWSVQTDPLPIFLNYARELKLDLNKFADCMANPEVKESVYDERREGDGLKILSTPTFFINGERVVGQVEFRNRGENLIRQRLGLPQLPPPPPSTAPAAPGGTPSAGEAPWTEKR